MRLKQKKKCLLRGKLGVRSETVRVLKPADIAGWWLCKFEDGTRAIINEENLVDL